MFSDNFKKELDPIQADQNLLAHTRQKVIRQKNLREGHVTEKPSSGYSKKRRYIRISAAAVCSLLVLAVLGIFLGNGGTNLTARLFSQQTQAKSADQLPVFTQSGLSPATEAAAATDSETAVSADSESGSHSSNHFNDGGIYNFADYESILTVLEKSWARVNDGYTFFGEDISGAVSDPAMPATDSQNGTGPTTALGKTDAEAPAVSGYSQTNVQVKGVDEADIIKNDGEYIYCIIYSSLYVLDVRDPENMKVAAVIADDFSLTDYYQNYSDLFYDSDSKTLSVISNSYYGNSGIVYPEMAPAAGTTGIGMASGSTGSGMVSGSTDTAPAASSSDSILPPDSAVSAGAASKPYYGGMYPSQEYTKLQTYDVSDPYSPKEIRTFCQDGYYISSRRIEGTVYLITSQNLWYDSTLKAEDLMPSTSDGKDNWATIPAPDIYIVNPDYASTYTIVSAVDTRSTGIPARTQAVVGQGTVVYASTDTLYITASIWDTSIYPMYDTFSGAQTNGKITAPVSDDVYKTKILAFTITNGSLEAKASGTVNGTLLNQYSMDEYQGNLRIATTSGNWTNDTSNNVFVLNGNLDMISGLTGLAPGEQIYSVRFAEDRIYLVTFQQVDPFFVIDASDPTKLTVLGKLKIPGYSNYMQMLGDNKVLAIGNTTYVSSGSVIPAGLKIAVFDVTDPADPILQSSLVYGDTYGYSDVQYNPKALLLDQSRGLIGLPVSFDLAAGNFGTDYVTGYLLLHFDDNGNLTHDYLFKDIDMMLSYGMCRGILINDTIFLVGYTEVLAYNLDSHELAGSLPLYQN
ncbi:MAG: beta-propeller domain-containing protein [Eubacteriales bacterium]